MLSLEEIIHFTGGPKYLGFKHDEHKNKYYTYGHDHIFLYCCFKNKIKAHRWIKIDDTTFEERIQ